MTIKRKPSGVKSGRFFILILNLLTKFVDRKPKYKGKRKEKKPEKHRFFKAFSMVGVAGFEPTASWTRTKRDTKLRHTPER